MVNILLDATIGVVILGSLYAGYRRGLVSSLLGLAGFTTVLFLCLAFGERLSRPFEAYFPLPSTYATLAGYIWICFVITLLAYLLHRVFSKLLTKRLPPGVDAMGGMFVGALRGAVFTALCLVILLLMTSPAIHEHIRTRSRIGSAFFRQVRKVSPTVNEILGSPTSPVEEKRVKKEKGEYEKIFEPLPGRGETKK